MKRSSMQGTFLLLFFISGAAGLIYEVIWVRRLVLVFGNTVHASATVLAAFMAGMGLGSYAMGRRISRVTRPLRLYGLFQLGIGVTASLVWPCMLLCRPLHDAVFRACDGPHAMVTVIRFVLAFVIMVLPVSLMGATLPLLCHAFIADIPRAAAWVGGLYFVNTAGAVVGCLASGFVLLPAMGLGWTSLLSSLISLVAGVLAIVVSRRGLPVTPAAPRDSAAPAARRRLLPVVTIALSGFCALALEVVWTRLFLMVYGSTTYSFTIMLGVFLLGLAAGSGLWGRLISRGKGTARGEGLLVLLLGAAGLLVLAGLWQVNRLPHLFLLIVREFETSWGSFLLAKLLISVLVLFPVACCFGGVLPACTAIVVRDRERVGAQVGLLYAWNSWGAIAGAVVGGFVMVPMMGTETGLRVLAGLLLAAALLVGIVRARRRGRRSGAWIALAPLLLVLVMVTPGIDPATVSLGVYFRPHRFIAADGRVTLEAEKRRQKLIFFEEGISSTVTIREYPTYREHLIDGKVEATTLIEDMRLQKMMAYLPLLLVEQPASVLNIGMGSGITLGAVAEYPVSVLDCVEIEEATREVARLFREYNGNVIEDSRLAFILNDGRHHLRLTDRRYDVITSDPFEPVVGGAASLFAREHFAYAAARLNPGGCMAQFLPLYELFQRDYQGIIKTFHSVFPHVLIWYAGGDSILLGFNDEPVFDLNRIALRLHHPGLRRGLQSIGLDTPAGLFGSFVIHLGPDDDIFDDQVRLNTDATPWVEFSAPRAHVKDTVPENLHFLLKHVRPFPARLVTARQGREGVEALVEGWHLLCHQYLAGKAAFLDGRLDDAETAYRSVLSFQEESRYMQRELATVLHWQARALIQRRDLVRAGAKLAQCRELGAPGPHVLADMAFVALLMGKPDEARKLVGTALAMAPEAPKLLMIEGQILLTQGSIRAARKRFADALRFGGDPREVEALQLKADRAAEKLGSASSAFRGLME